MATIPTTVNGTAPSQGKAGEMLVFRLYQRCEWGELMLMRHGWTSDRLQREARKIANDYIKLNVPYMGERREDLVSFLTLKALQAVPRFRPDHPISTYGSNGGDHFSSWVCDVMSNRCVDWYRSKAEGWGDRRYNNDNRQVLTDDPDPADHDTDFQELVDERRRSRWQQAATQEDMPLSQYMVKVMDIASDAVLRSAA